MNIEEIKAKLSDATPKEKTYILNLCELAYTGNQESLKILRDMFGEIITVADVFKLSGAVIRSMSKNERRHDESATEQRLSALTKLNPSKIISNLAKYRIIADLTQQQLADQTGISVRTIQKWESRERDIKKAQINNILALAKVLSVEPEDLL